MKRNLKASGVVVWRLGMTRRVDKVQHVVYSETRGKRSCTLEVVLDASAG